MKDSSTEREDKLRWALDFVLSQSRGECLDPEWLATKVNELFPGTASKDWVIQRLEEIDDEAIEPIHPPPRHRNCRERRTDRT